MNRLPDLIIIDFCEWLNQKISSRQDSLDLFDLILNQEHSGSLKKYAKEYLGKKYYGEVIKQILHRFIDSEGFTRQIRRFEDCWYPDYYDSKELYYWITKMNLTDELYAFLENDIHYITPVCTEPIIEPYELADSVYKLFSKARNSKSISKENKLIMRLMNQGALDMGIEVDFLEWLIQTLGEPIDFRKMPLKTFEDLASKFQKACNKDEQQKRKLIKSFKQTQSFVLYEKLANVLPVNTARRARDLGYIINRYQDKNVRYKCLIIPLQADSKQYIELIEKRWYDLHYLSGDYLDIFYSKADYGKSGFQIADQISCIPEELKTNAPLIILWENDLHKAKGIDITRLDNADVFEVIRCIVNAIREDKNIEKIVEEGNQMSRELREKQRHVNNINNSLSIDGGAIVNGPVAVVNEHGEMISNIVGEKINDADVLHELEEAKAIIRDYSEMNDRQKQLLEEIIDEAKIAIKVNSMEKKDASKKRFKDAIDLIGIGSKLLSAFSALTNVLKYFGFTPAQ